jgi:hypothetical protein
MRDPSTHSLVTMLRRDYMSERQGGVRLHGGVVLGLDLR